MERAPRKAAPVVKQTLASPIVAGLMQVNGRGDPPAPMMRGVYFGAGGFGSGLSCRFDQEM